MCQPTQNAAFAFEPLLAALPHQRDIENLHRYAPLKIARRFRSASQTVPIPPWPICETRV